MTDDIISTYPIDFNYTHIMSLNPEEKHAECGSVHNSEAVRPSGLKGKRRIFIKPGKIRRVLGVVDQCGIYGVHVLEFSVTRAQNS